MTHRQSDGSVTDDPSVLLSEKRFFSLLQPEQPSGRSASSIDLSRAPSPDRDRRTPVVLSTQSQAARRLGTQQLIPKNLAVSSRPKQRHHTTVVTLPVTDLSWEDYDSDGGDGSSFRRNRRNKSYRAAVTSLNIEALTCGDQTDLLPPVSEDTTMSSKQPEKSGRKASLLAI